MIFKVAALFCILLCIVLGLWSVSFCVLFCSLHLSDINYLLNVVQISPLSSSELLHNVVVAIKGLVKSYHIMILVCFSLVDNGFEHLFMRLLVIYVSLEKCLFKYVVHLKLGCLYYWVIIVKRLVDSVLDKNLNYAILSV